MQPVFNAYTGIKGIEQQGLLMKEENLVRKSDTACSFSECNASGTTTSFPLPCIFTILILNFHNLRNLFLLSMKIALLSDVHGNLEALQSVLRSITRQHVDRVLFLGDIVGYGANPNECIEAVRETADVILAGNHDWAAIGKSATYSFNPVALAAIRWTENRLQPQHRAFLAALPLQYATDDFLCVHATPQHPEAWGYIIDEDDAAVGFEHFPQQACFTAHSHYPIIFVRDKTGMPWSENKMEIKLREGLRYIINSGSVGQPRDGNPQASYGIYDGDSREYRRVRVSYDIEGAQKKILGAGLPAFLAARLSLGR